VKREEGERMLEISGTEAGKNSDMSIQNFIGQKVVSVIFSKLLKRCKLHNQLHNYIITQEILPPWLLNELVPVGVNYRCGEVSGKNNHAKHHR